MGFEAVALESCGLPRLTAGIRRIFGGCLRLETRRTLRSAIQLALCGNSARKQFLEIAAFQSSSIDDDMIDFIHDSLYWYLRITLTTTPWIFTRDPSTMIGSRDSFAG